MTMLDDIATGRDDAPPEAAASLFDRIKANRAAALSDLTIDLPIPGWDFELVARYKVVDPLVEGADIAKRVSKQFPGNLAAQEFYALVDSMIAACVGLYGREDDGILKPVSVDGDDPVRYDQNLASALDLPDPKARNVVIGVFRGNKAAVRFHGMRLQMWMADPDGDAGLGGRA